jgi:colicin import membrane protein
MTRGSVKLLREFLEDKRKHEEPLTRSMSRPAGDLFLRWTAVRKASKVNMNDAATAMKQWRRAQTAQAAPVAITVPDAVHQLHSQALAALWQSAQNTANESLRAAQAGWEAERAEAETLNKQLGDAYDAQAVELETACRQIEELTAQNQAEQKRSTELAQQLQETVNAKLAAESRATIAEQRAVEIDRRAADLRAELDLAHQDAVQTRTRLRPSVQGRVCRRGASGTAEDRRPGGSSEPPSALPRRRWSVTKPARKLPRRARKPPTGAVRSKP